jgi:hypothetical protein
MTAWLRSRPQPAECLDYFHRHLEMLFFVNLSRGKTTCAFHDYR